jgi:hypothetical protein
VEGHDINEPELLYAKFTFLSFQEKV